MFCGSKLHLRRPFARPGTQTEPSAETQLEHFRYTNVWSRVKTCATFPEIAWMRLLAWVISCLHDSKGHHLEGFLAVSNTEQENN